MRSRAKSVSEIEVAGKHVLVRGDFDVDDGINPRADSIRTMVEYLQNKGAVRIKVIGHSETKYDLAGELGKEYPGVEFDSGLRNNPGEKENSEELARSWAGEWDVYVNEAFATAHRVHASVVALPGVMRQLGREVGMGLRFEKELEMLSGVWEKPGRRVLVIGGVKVEDKQKFALEQKDKFAAILLGGLLPGVELRPDGLDISQTAREKYVAEIAAAEVILAAGVMGKYEDAGAVEGTRAVLQAIADNPKAYKVAGGGDIEMAISTFNLTQKFDWISVGGGAMLEFLGQGTLPGLTALIE